MNKEQITPYFLETILREHTKLSHSKILKLTDLITAHMKEHASKYGLSTPATDEQVIEYDFGDGTVQPFVDLVTEIMREADIQYESSGGSTRHYVRDLLLPMMADKGIRVSIAARKHSVTPEDEHTGECFHPLCTCREEDVECRAEIWKGNYKDIARALALRVEDLKLQLEAQDANVEILLDQKEQLQQRIAELESHQLSEQEILTTIEKIIDKNYTDHGYGCSFNKGQALFEVEAALTAHHKQHSEK